MSHINVTCYLWHVKVYSNAGYSCDCVLPSWPSILNRFYGSLPFSLPPLLCLGRWLSNRKYSCRRSLHLNRIRSPPYFRHFLKHFVISPLNSDVSVPRSAPVITERRRRACTELGSTIRWWLLRKLQMFLLTAKNMWITVALLHLGLFIVVLFFFISHPTVTRNKKLNLTYT